MPQLIFKGIPIEQVKEISTVLVRELAELCHCEEDNFTLEIPQSTYVFNQEEVPAFPFIEVRWFERGQEVQDQFASIITNHIRSLGIQEVEVAFSVYREAAYYYNGKHF